MSPLAVVVLIVLVDLLGFTVVMPLLPRFAEQYDLEGWQIGLLFSTYPLCQLVAGPILGRLSDRYGRRPVLIASQAGTALSFVMLGLAQDFPTMLLARALDGASGGNILVAQAYVADVTTPENRARGLGLIGMAFGIGFVLGPLLGGILVGLPVADDWRLRLPFFVGAAFSTIAFVLVLLRLPESLPADSSARKHARVVTIHGLVETLSRASTARLVGLGFLVTLSFACLEGTFSLFLEKRMGWNASQASYGFAFLGFVSAVVQGGLIRRLVARFGETGLIVAGATALTIGLATLANMGTVPVLVASTVVIAVGQGLLSPSVSGLLSRVTPPSEQGSVFGTFSSAQTLARMLSYSVANVLLARFGPSAPFWAGSGVAVAALGLGVVVSRHAREDRVRSPSSATHGGVESNLGSP
jgi:DHA1 family tetracycline resistance protein-like MFS transporter